MQRPIPTWLARSLRVLGVVLVLGGLGHAAGVTHKYASVGWSERHKVEFVAFIGLAHLTGGALDLLAAGMLRRGEPSATRATILACGFTIAWTSLDLPILFAEAKLFFQIMPVVYSRPTSRSWSRSRSAGLAELGGRGTRSKSKLVQPGVSKARSKIGSALEIMPLRRSNRCRMLFAPSEGTEVQAPRFWPPERVVALTARPIRSSMGAGVARHFDVRSASRATAGIRAAAKGDGAAELGSMLKCPRRSR